MDGQSSNGGEVDLDAYFQRIGYTGGRAPTLATLRALHELHPQAITFENLDPLLKRPVRLDLGSLQEKLVNDGRGGYCYEHNLLFAAVLRQLGFRVTELSGRVLWSVPPGATVTRTHVMLLVDVAGEPYLADVGFGGNVLTGPLALHETGEQATPHELCRLSKMGDTVLLEAKIKNEWGRLYQFYLQEQDMTDHELGNWYVATHPNSRFVKGLMVARPEPGRRYALANNEFATHKLGGPSEKQTLATAAELRDALADVFRIELPKGPELDAVLARFTGGSP